jgi:hypothetical protein
MSKNPHEHDLEIVAAGLAHLLPRVVFVGGAVVGFYVTDEGAPTVRGTEDIDCVVELHSQTDYHQLNSELVALGFRNDTSPDAPICRYLYKGYVVDIMPTDEKTLGFTNRWYAEGVTAAQTMALKSGKSIQVLTIPYFIACKFAAHAGRGADDFMGSRDVQDIIAILDGHLDVEAVLTATTGALDAYLRESFRSVFDIAQEEIQGHLSGDFKSRRADKIQQIIARIYGPMPSAVRRSSMFLGF